MNVIDSFVVELGLDSRKFNEGERDAIQSFEKTKNEAVGFGKTVEEQGVKLADIFSTVKKGAIGIVGAFAGAEVATFIDKVAQADATTSRLARSIGQSVEGLSLWQGMVRQVGGSAEDATSTITGLVDAMNSVASGAGFFSGPFATLLNRAVPNWRQETNNPTAILRQIAGWLDTEVKSGHITPAQQRWWLEQIPGISGPMLLLLQKGPQGLNETADAAKKAGIETQAAGQAAEDYSAKVSLLDQALQNLARVTYPSLTSAINAVSQSLSSGYGGWIASILAGAGIGAVSGSFIPGVGTGIGAIAGGIAGAVTYGTSAGSASAPAAAPAAPSFFGFRGSSRGDRNNNPGNIEYGQFAIAHGATGSDGRFAIFPSLAAGEAAMAQLLYNNYAGLSLYEIQRKWVGNSDPNYLRSMMAATGLGAGDVPDLNNNGVVAALIRGMTRGEGTHVGNVWTGIPTAGTFGLPVGASGAAAASTVNNRAGNTSTHSSSVTIGNINVSSSKADPGDVADAIPDSMRRMANAIPANSALV